MTNERNAAASRVRFPAACLLAVGLIDAVLAIVVVVSGFFTGAFRLGPQEGVIGVLALVASAAIMFGVCRMGQLRGLGLARTASILVLIPCLSICLVLGVPVGIWSLVVLSDPDVKSAFQ